MNIYSSKNSHIYYDNSILTYFGCIKDHYEYILKLLKSIIDSNDLNINILFCCNNILFNNTNKTITININYEHTIVKKGGRSVHPNCPLIKLNNIDYHIRIDRFNILNEYDIIIEYSNPNIKHMSTNNLFQNYVNKCVYVSSCIFDNTYFIKEGRTLSTLTTFINTNEPRRFKLLEDIKNRNIHHENVNDCFDINELKKLYMNTKVIINIHQTDHHDTFEELRILPCIQCGVIPICEYSPYQELVPYNDYIIWTSYDNILNTVEEVLKNYDYYFNKIFIDKKNIDINELPNINYNNLLNFIKSKI